MQRTGRGREKSYPSWWINCQGRTCNFLSLLSPWVRDLTGVGLSCVSSLGVLHCLTVGRAHQPADKVLSFPEHGKTNQRNKTWPQFNRIRICRWEMSLTYLLTLLSLTGRRDICWITQEWVKGTLLDIGWIWCWSSHCKTMLAISREEQNW